MRENCSLDKWSNHFGSKSVNQIFSIVKRRDVMKFSSNSSGNFPRESSFINSRHYRIIKSAVALFTKMCTLKRFFNKYRVSRIVVSRSSMEIFSFEEKFKWVYVIASKFGISFVHFKFHRLCYCLQYIKFGFTISGMFSTRKLAAICSNTIPEMPEPAIDRYKDNGKILVGDSV